MLKSLKKSITSLPSSTKTMFLHQPNFFQKVVKMSKSRQNKRKFSGFMGLKSSFASLELSNQLQLVFKFIDANGDGKTSSNELSEFLICLGHDKSKVSEEANGMLKYMDLNGDGFVDLNDYMNVVMMRYDGCDDEEELIMNAFHVFDVDKDGLISSKELKHALNKLGFLNCSIKECNLMIKGVDQDGDGFVNFNEFRLMMMA